MRQSNCFPEGDRTISGSHGFSPGRSSMISNGLHVKPPSSEMLCTTTFDLFSFVSPGRRILVLRSDLWPASLDALVQNGMTLSPGPSPSTAVHVRPASVE